MRAAKGLRCEKGMLSAADFYSSRQLHSLILAASRKTGEPPQGGSIILRDEDGVAALVIHSVVIARGPVKFAPGASWTAHF